MTKEFREVDRLRRNVTGHGNGGTISTSPDTSLPAGAFRQNSRRGIGGCRSVFD